MDARRVRPLPDDAPAHRYVCPHAEDRAEEDEPDRQAGEPPLQGLSLTYLGAEKLARSQLAAARLALHGKGRVEACVATGTAGAELTAALRTGPRQIRLPSLEVPLRVAAGEADRDPVPERLAALLLQPVSSVAHASDSSSRRGSS
jgi:hypothetical protein